MADVAGVYDTCQTCQGDGEDPDRPGWFCYSCGGKGDVLVVDLDEDEGEYGDDD